MFKKTYSLKQTKEIINFFEVNKNEDDFHLDLVLYCLKFEEIDFDNITEDNKKKLIVDVSKKINNSLEKYNSIIQASTKSGRIFLTIDGKDYKSSYINVEIYLNIVKMFMETLDPEKNVTLDDIIEYTLLSIFSDIIHPSKIYDLKEDDPLYYEIVMEEVTNLILKTKTDCDSIETISNPFKLNDKLEIELYEKDIYSQLLEGFNLLPSSINNEKVFNIFNMLNNLKLNSIEKDINSHLQEARPQLSEFEFDVYKEQLLNKIKKGGGK
jgi:hypothetical protein